MLIKEELRIIDLAKRLKEQNEYVALEPETIYVLGM